MNPTLYIRHGEKSYSNGNYDEFSLDPGLTENGKFQAKDRFKQLLNLYGIPATIVSSPYLRARETAQIAHDVIFEETGIFIQIIYDPIIGEYLGNQKLRYNSKSLHNDTLIHNPIPPENWNVFVRRVNKHYKSHPHSGWYITHGVFIQQFAKLHNITMKRPSELNGILITNQLLTFV